MKTCYRCRLDKPDSEFNQNRTKHDGRSSFCKKCSTDYCRGWYAKNKVRHRAYIKAVKKRRVEENRQRLRAYFEAHPCVDCGETDIIVLEFDHVFGKKRCGVPLMVAGGVSWEVILSEIDKCLVRCANCHKRMTAKRGKSWRASVA